jgi:hypothetical protein
VATTAGATSGEDGEPRVVLYCVRPDAIQQCTLDPALCRPSASLSAMCDLAMQHIQLCKSG